MAGSHRTAAAGGDMQPCSHAASAIKHGNTARAPQTDFQATWVDCVNAELLPNRVHTSVLQHNTHVPVTSPSCTWAAHVLFDKTAAHKLCQRIVEGMAIW